MADARASCEFAVAARAGDSRATTSAEWPAAVGAVARATNVAHAPADAIIQCGQVNRNSWTCGTILNRIRVVV